MNFLDRLLAYYSLSKEEYEYMSRPLSEVVLKDPLKIEGMKEAISRIHKAIENKEKIIVYGDYDCDGISATSIMVKTFKILNYPIYHYIPSRYLDGYGLNTQNTKKIIENDFKLIITVDNGISAFEAISLAKDSGVDVIVVDHHEVMNNTLPEAISIIHPTVSHVSEIIASGGYMSLFLSAALLGYYDDYLVTIAGISIISDLMELKDYNRDVVRLAINNLKTHKYLPLMLLLDNKEVISEKSFSLEIAPKINAIGRMITNKTINKLINFLTSDDSSEIISLSEWIRNTNEERKILTKQAYESINMSEFNEPAVIIEMDIKEGLIGLVANKIMNETNKVSIVFTSDEKDTSILKGSIRSKEGFNISKALEELNKYLLSGGGHALAGGLSIKKEDFTAFKEEFNALASKYPIIEVSEQTIPFEISEINQENFQIYKSLSPYGMGLKEPVLKISNLPTRNLKFISFGKHLSTELTMKSKLLGFNMPQEEVIKHPLIDIEGSLNLSVFNKKETLEFRIAKYYPSKVSN